MYNKKFFEKRSTGRAWAEVSMFSSRLRILRKKKGETQESAADKMGISKATYGTYENGKYLPDAEKIAKIADFYNVSADYLLGLINTPTPNENYITAGYSRKCIDVLLDISKSQSKKRAFEYIVRNKRFEELLTYIDTYLLFSRKLSRDADQTVRDTYDEISKIDTSTNKYLSNEAFSKDGLKIPDVYLGLIYETLRDLLVNVSREDICSHIEEMKKIISKEIPENDSIIFGCGNGPKL